MTCFFVVLQLPKLPTVFLEMEAFRDKARQLLEETGTERSSRSSEGFGSVESSLPKDMGAAFSIPLVDKGTILPFRLSLNLVIEY